MREAGFDPEMLRLKERASAAMQTLHDAYSASIPAQQRDVQALTSTTVGECLRASQQSVAQQMAALGKSEAELRALASGSTFGALGEAERRRLSGQSDAKEYADLLNARIATSKLK